MRRPKPVNASDLLARMIGCTHCSDATPVRKEARRAMRFYCACTAAKGAQRE